MTLFVLVQILFQYLEKVDPSLLLLAKEVSFMFKLTAMTLTFADITPHQLLYFHHESDAQGL